MVINEPPGGRSSEVFCCLNELRERRSRHFWSWAAMVGWALFALHVWWRW